MSKLVKAHFVYLLVKLAQPNVQQLSWVIFAIRVRLLIIVEVLLTLHSGCSHFGVAVEIQVFVIILTPAKKERKLSKKAR